LDVPSELGGVAAVLGALAEDLGDRVDDQRVGQEADAAERDDEAEGPKETLKA
jgi:hypothetical protein